MTDRTTKILLLLIAIGLWGHLLGTWLRPSPVAATVPLTTSVNVSAVLQNPPASLDTLERIEWYLRQLHWGNCRNDKIC